MRLTAICSGRWLISACGICSIVDVRSRTFLLWIELCTYVVDLQTLRANIEFPIVHISIRGPAGPVLEELDAHRG